MENTIIIERLYGEWSPQDVAFIHSIQWASSGNGRIILETIVQPRQQIVFNKVWPLEQGPWFFVSLEFTGIHNLCLKSFNAGMRQITGFSIENIKVRGMENIEWQVEDYEENIISFCSKTASILSASKYDDTVFPVLMREW